MLHGNGHNFVIRHQNTANAGDSERGERALQVYTWSEFIQITTANAGVDFVEHTYVNMSVA